MDLLDTDVLIDIQRGHAPTLSWFLQLQELPAVPGFVAMELVQDARNSREVKKALKLVEPLPIVWPKSSDCQSALEIFAIYHLSHGLGLMDALIAATAVGHSATLSTFNTKHYHSVPGLKVKKPFAKA